MSRIVNIAVIAWCITGWLAPAAVQAHVSEKIGGYVDAGVKPYQSKEKQVSGKLVVGAAESMKRLMDLWGAGFEQRHKGAKVDTTLIRFSDAAKAVTKDVVPIPDGADLLAVSYPLSGAQLSEIRAGRGILPVHVPVALDAIVLVVHHRNPLPGLTLGEVERMFAKSPHEGANVDHWHQVGLNTAFGPLHINRYGRDGTSGTFAAFKEMVLRGAEQRSDVFVQTGSMSVIIEVGSDEAGIGYASTGFAYRNKKVRILPLATRPGETFVFPTNETVISGTYPLSRPLYLYAVPEADGTLKPAIREFIAFVLSREGQRVVVEENFVPLPAQRIEQSLQDLEDQRGIPSAQFDLGSQAKPD